ncbi:MAG: hypothetical protein AAFY41_09025, partial [Bacteroidota bacterium]
MRRILTIIFSVLFLSLKAQVFGPGAVQLLVKKGTDHIYNANEDSAEYYIAKAEQFIPDHPV